MFYNSALNTDKQIIQRLTYQKSQYFLAFAVIGALFAYWWFGPYVLAGLISFLSAAVLVLIRIDLAFYILIALYMSGTAIPLPVASPFTPGVYADLPLYEVFAPLVGLCILVKIAIRKERVPRSPLNVPMLLWFGLSGMTYFRNPLFVSDLFSKSGTGAIYHSLYPLAICGVFYLSASSILRSRKRITVAAKIVFAVMIVGMLVMVFMLITGWKIPLLTGGRSPWEVRTQFHRGRTVFRIMAMGTYSSLLIGVLLCFGQNMRKFTRILIFLALAVGLVMGGGRGTFIMAVIFSLAMFIVQPRARRSILIGAVTVAVFILLIFVYNIQLPYTTRRILDFSRDSSIGVGGRVRMWERSLYIIKHRPITGHGYGTLRHYYPELEMSKEFVSGDPHSGFLSIMTNQGLIGLSVFLWLMIAAIETGRGLYRNIEDMFLKKLMLWLTLYLSTSLVVFFVSFQMERNIFVYAGMGIISATYAMYMKRDTTVDGSDFGQRFDSEFVS